MSSPLHSVQSGPAPSFPSAALVQDAQRGDSLALAQLLGALRPAMHRAVASVLGPSASDTEDATQDAMMELAAALPQFRGESTLLRFAYRIAVRRALYLRRLNQSRSAKLAGLGASSPRPWRRDPTRDGFARRQRREALRQVLDQLPLEQAETLAHRIILGACVAEIATLMGVPHNTVRSRLRLAKAALRKKFLEDPQLVDALAEAE